LDSDSFSDCGVPLVEELALEEKDNKPINNSNWALLLQTYDEREAEMLQALLQSAGIPVIRKDRGAGGYLKIHMGMNKLGVDIYVPEEYYEEALSVIPPVEGQFLDGKDEELVLQSNQINPRIEKKHKASSWIYFLAFVAIPMIIYLLSSFWNIFRRIVNS